MNQSRQTKRAEVAPAHDPAGGEEPFFSPPQLALGRRGVGPDLLTLLIFLATGIVSIWFLLDGDTYVGDAHPQIRFLLSHALHTSIPEHHSVIDWFPYWNAGFPELQFYPPGFVYVAAALNLLTFGLLPPERLYGVFCLAAYLAPGLCTYAALRWLRFSPFVAFWPAFLLMVADNLRFSGVLGAMIIGMIASRMALSIFPLLFATLIKYVATTDPAARRRLLVIYIVLAGFLFLCHPYHIFTPLLFVLPVALVWGLTAQESRPLLRPFLFLVVPAVIALNLDLILPALLRREQVPAYTMISFDLPVIINDLFIGRSGDGLFTVLVLVPFINSARMPQLHRLLVRSLLILLPVVFTFALLLHLVLERRLGIYQLSAARFTEDFKFVMLILSGLGLSAVIQSFLRAAAALPWYCRRILCPATLAFVLFVVFFPQLDDYIYFQHFQKEPSGSKMAMQMAAVRSMRGSRVMDRFHIEQLWEALKRRSEGRVLFATQLYSWDDLPEDNTNWHSHLLCETPIHTGREVFGGGYTLVTPMGAAIMYGDYRRRTIDEFLETHMTKGVIGLPWVKMDGERLYDFCRRLDITDIVVSSRNSDAITFLSTDGHFSEPQPVEPFVLFGLLDYEHSYIETSNGEADLVKYAPSEHTIDVRVKRASAGARLTLKIYHYPLWRAYVQNESVAIETDEFGMAEIPIPEGADYDVSFRYERGPPEMIGRNVSLVSWAASLVLLAWNVLVRRGRCSE